MNSTTSASGRDVTVWYDGQCPLCLREIALMRRLDSDQRIDFVEVNESNGCPVDRRTLLERFHAQARGEDIVSGAAAFATMWRVLPSLRWLGRIATYRPVLWCLEKLYIGFLKVRPALQRLVPFPKNVRDADS